MKNFLLLLSIPAILISGGLKSSLLKSKKENRPIMVLVTAKHCKYCAKMKKYTLSNPDVISNLEGFIFTKVDKNSLDAQKYLPHTRYTPTVYFISPKFHVVNTVKGYLNAYDFNMWVDDTRKKLGMGTLSNIAKVDTTTSYVKPEKNSIWMYDVASAVDYANQTDKNIMIFVGSTKSKWSKKMETTTLKDKGIIKKLDKFVWVKLNHGDKDAKTYGINPRNVPVVYFMRANMSEIAVAKGYYKSKDFAKWIRYAKSKI